MNNAQTYPKRALAFALIKFIIMIPLSIMILFFSVLAFISGKIKNLLFILLIAIVGKDFRAIQYLVALKSKKVKKK